MFSNKNVTVRVIKGKRNRRNQVLNPPPPTGRDLSLFIFFSFSQFFTGDQPHYDSIIYEADSRLNIKN